MSNNFDPLHLWLSKKMPSDAQILLGKYTLPFKQYPRAEIVQLQRPSLAAVSLEQVLASRRCLRSFSGALTLEQVSALLYWSLGIREGSEAGRMHPSGGALYPLEAYISIATPGGLPCGVYHYNVEQHGLELLPGTAVEQITAALATQANQITVPHLTVLLSYIKSRNQPKYGNFGHKLALIEAGHIGQNFCLVAAGLGVAVRMLGLREYVVDLTYALGLDPEHEVVVYGMALGLQVATKDGLSVS